MEQVQTIEEFEPEVVKGESMILAGAGGLSQAELVPLSLSVLKDSNENYCSAHSMWSRKLWHPDLTHFQWRIKVQSLLG